MAHRDVEVVTVWCPRPDYEKWRDDYIDLLHLQRDSVLKIGHKHTVMTDGPNIPGFNCVRMPQVNESLMRLMIFGVLHRLTLPVRNHIVFVDVDVLVNRCLVEVFNGDFDLGLTRRINTLAPINNGAMYMDARSVAQSIRFFEKAYRLCGNHWGADQEAISLAAEPVPPVNGTHVRDGVRIAYLSMKTHNAVPKAPGQYHHARPYVLHFKGETKAWAREYATKYLGI